MIRSSSICMSFLYKYLMSESGIDADTEGDKLIKKGNKLKCLSEVFSAYGGVLGKLSQILCLENEKSDVFSDCKPYCQKETIEYIKNEFETNPGFFKSVKEIDFNVFKAGSVGQVHRGIYKDGREMIMKVQYIGLHEQFKSDIYILDKLASYLFYFSDLTSAMVDIKTKLYEELDYKLEFENQQTMQDLWKDDERIKIAELIPELSNDKILSMYFIDGEGLANFIANSTQEQRNVIGLYILDFIFTNLYKNSIFYSDNHVGNFLVKDKSILYVTDFGCINLIEEELLTKMKKLHKIMIDKNEDAFYEVVKELGILKDGTSQEAKEYMYEYFSLQYEPWTSVEFEFTEEWLKRASFKKAELMNDWVLPSNMVYFNKIPFGAYHIFTKLQMKGQFLDFFQTLLHV